MIRFTRRRCIFSIDFENRVMLLELSSLSSRLDEKLDMAEVINAALKSYLPSVLASFNRIAMDEDLISLKEEMKELEAELDEDAKWQ